jgi:UDP-N-acetylglucosamine--N-acetylmuramyl-(pentapeptide) pyrophosphoryl-undecaprenol N-acetylglucosamine transferase
MRASGITTIVLAGGGTLGHVAPSIAIAQSVRDMGPDLRCIFAIGGSEEEKKMVQSSGFDLWRLAAPRFPRTLSIGLLTFPFLFLLSLVRAFFFLRSIRPSVVFGKGGYVSVPVCVAAWIRRIPIVIHTSDAVRNVSDMLLMKIAHTVCTGFPMETLKRTHLYTGNPVRRSIRSGMREMGKKITGFSGDRPVLMVIGGSQGSRALNEAVIRHWDSLLALVDIIHLTGRGKVNNRQDARYFVREMESENLPHLYALADFVLTRAGAGALSELASLKKTTIVTPLTGVAHDHQRLNAEYLVSAGAAYYLEEEQLDLLPDVLTSLLHDRMMSQSMSEAIGRCFPEDAAERVAILILDAVKNGR